MTLAAIALVLVPVIPAVISELFWFTAQNRAERQLLKLIERTGSAAEAERLMRLLLAAHREVLTARASTTHIRHVRSRRYGPSPECPGKCG